MKQKDRDKLTEKFKDTKWILYGLKGSDFFVNIYPSPGLLAICGDGDRYKLELSLHENQTLGEELGYYGWISFDRSNSLSMIYSTVFQVNMCFISGYEVCEDLGQGVAVRLVVKDLGIVK